MNCKSYFDDVLHNMGLDDAVFCFPGSVDFNSTAYALFP